MRLRLTRDRVSVDFDRLTRDELVDAAWRALVAGARRVTVQALTEDTGIPTAVLWQGERDGCRPGVAYVWTSERGREAVEVPRLASDVPVFAPASVASPVKIIDCPNRCEIPKGVVEVPRPRHAWRDVVVCPHAGDGCERAFLLPERVR